MKVQHGRKIIFEKGEYSILKRQSKLYYKYTSDKKRIVDKKIKQLVNEALYNYMNNITDGLQFKTIG